MPKSRSSNDENKHQYDEELLEGRNLSLLSAELRLQTGKCRNSMQKNVVKRQGGLLELLLSLQ